MVFRQYPSNIQEVCRQYAGSIQKGTRQDSEGNERAFIQVAFRLYLDGFQTVFKEYSGRALS